MAYMKPLPGGKEQDEDWLTTRVHRSVVSQRPLLIRDKEYAH